LEAIKAEAEARGINVQELIRAVIIPDWIRQNQRQGLPSKSPSSCGNSPMPVTYGPRGAMANQALAFTDDKAS